MKRSFSIRSALVAVAAIAVVLTLLFNTNSGRTWIRLTRHRLAERRLQYALNDIRPSVRYYGKRGISPHWPLFPKIYVLSGRDVTEQSLMNIINAVKTLDAKDRRGCDFKLCDTPLSNESIRRLADELPFASFVVENNGTVVYRYSQPR